MPYKDREKNLQYLRDWYQKNRKQQLLYCKEYQKLNREKLRIYTAEYRRKSPWLTSYMSAEQRCNNKNHHGYKYYGGRGVKFLLTKEEVKSLWIRDKAHLLKWPSIDRIDNNADYELSNCRFIEMGENSRKAHVGKKRTK